MSSNDPTGLDSAEALARALKEDGVDGEFEIKPKLPERNMYFQQALGNSDKSLKLKGPGKLIKLANFVLKFLDKKGKLQDLQGIGHYPNEATAKNGLNILEKMGLRAIMKLTYKNTPSSRMELKSQDPQKDPKKVGDTPASKGTATGIVGVSVSASASASASVKDLLIAALKILLQAPKDKDKKAGLEQSFDLEQSTNPAKTTQHRSLADKLLDTAKGTKPRPPGEK
jgi:hypothetical protein